MTGVQTCALPISSALWAGRSGDVTQIDLPKGQMSGLIDAERVLKRVKGIAHTRFTSADVVRHPLVARIVDAYDAVPKA